jgi:hypothetical protein
MAFLEAARAKLVKRENLQSQPSSTSSSLHTYDPAQCVEFTQRLNKVLAGEAWWTPLNPAGGELFAKMADGEFLCRLLNKCEAGSVPEAVLATRVNKKGSTAFHNADTVTHFITSARKAGLEMVGLGATDFTRAVEEHKQHLVMGALWQLLKRQLANEIKAILARQQAEAEKRGRKLANYSALMALVLKDPEAYLCQWVNETMKAKGVPLANEGRGAGSMAELSLGSSDTLLRLMHALDPASPATQLAAVHAAAPEGRAAAALDWVLEHAIVAATKAEDLLGNHTSVLMPFVLQIFTWASQQPGKESMYVLRSHTHVPAGDAGRFVSASVCLGVYKKEEEALQCVEGAVRVRASSLLLFVCVLALPHAHPPSIPLPPSPPCRNALVHGICALALDRNLAPLEELTAAYAKATGDVVAVVTAALAPVAALLQLARAAPPLPADELRERVELGVTGRPAAASAAVAAAAAAGAPAAEGGGGGGGGGGGAAATPGLSPEDLQAHYSRVSGMMKCVDNSKGTAVFFEVDTVQRY